MGRLLPRLLHRARHLGALVQLVHLVQHEAHAALAVLAEQRTEELGVERLWLGDERAEHVLRHRDADGALLQRLRQGVRVLELEGRGEVRVDLRPLHARLGGRDGDVDGQPSRLVELVERIPHDARLARARIGVEDGGALRLERVAQTLGHIALGGVDREGGLRLRRSAYHEGPVCCV